MTNREAIEHLEGEVGCVELDDSNGRPMGEGGRKFIDACNIAIEAMKRDEPKPVKYLNRHGEGMDLWNKDYYNCPSCGRRLRNKKPDPFCPKCGQALTWEVA